jgi:hypothetical protein
MAGSVSSLKRASASRPSNGPDDAYDLSGRGGRPHLPVIRRAIGPPLDVGEGHNGDIKRAAHGYEPARGCDAFATSWRRES